MGVILPPYSAFLQQKITECEALRETNETMDQELAHLKYENQRLEAQVNKLESSVNNFKEMEHTLQVLRKMEHVSLEDLQQQLQESQGILDQLEVSFQEYPRVTFFFYFLDNHDLDYHSLDYGHDRLVWLEWPYKVRIYPCIIINIHP
jgi:vacuolar-type H+-ATPase subunit I/STV1